MGNTQSVQEPILHERAKCFDSLRTNRNNFVGVALSPDVVQYVLRPYVLPPMLLAFTREEYFAVSVEHLSVYHAYEHSRTPDARFIVPLWNGAIDCWSKKDQLPERISPFYAIRPAVNMRQLNSLYNSGGAATPRRSFVCGGEFRSLTDRYKYHSLKIYAVDEQHGVVTLHSNAPFAKTNPSVAAIDDDYLVIASNMTKWSEGLDSSIFVDSFVGYDVTANRFDKIDTPIDTNAISFHCTNWHKQLLVFTPRLTTSQCRFDLWLHDRRSPRWELMNGNYSYFDTVTRFEQDHFIWVGKELYVTKYDLRNGACVQQERLRPQWDPSSGDPPPPRDEPTIKKLVYCDP